MSCTHPTSRLRAWLGAASVLTLLLAPLPVSAQAPAGPPRLDDPDARAAQTEGEEAFNAGRYLEASEAFQRAYALEPAAFLLFSRAQAERLAERCDEAVELFSAYIDTGPSQEAASMALERIHLCGGEYRSAAESDEDAQDEAAETPQPTVPQPVSPQPTTQGPEGPAEGDTSPVTPDRRVPGRSWALLGTGGFVLAGGAGLLAGAGVTTRRAGTVFGEAQADSLGATARGLAIGGAVALSVGAALLIAGIVDASRATRRPQLVKQAR